MVVLLLSAGTGSAGDIETDSTGRGILHGGQDK